MEEYVYRADTLDKWQGTTNVRSKISLDVCGKHIVS